MSTNPNLSQSESHSMKTKRVQLEVYRRVRYEQPGKLTLEVPMDCTAEDFDESFVWELAYDLDIDLEERFEETSDQWTRVDTQNTTGRCEYSEQVSPNEQTDCKLVRHQDGGLAVSDG